MAEPSIETIVKRLGADGRSALATYALAITAVVVAVLLRYLLDPWIGNALPLVTLFGAVAAAVWVGGYGPAIVVVLLGYLACDYLFIDPRGRLGLQTLGSRIGLLAYLSTCSLIIAFGEATRIAQRRASQRRELLRVTLRSIGDAVITTDVEGRVTSLNAVAESLTGWTQRDAVGQPLEMVFRIVNEETRQPAPEPGDEGASGRCDRRAGESHRADLEGRGRSSD